MRVFCNRPSTWIVFMLATVILAACSGGGAATPAATARAASAAATAAPTQASATPAATAAVSVVPSTAPSGAPPSVAPAATHVYDCAKLVTDAEMRQATGLADAALFHGNGVAVKGQTYCQFFARSGATAIAVSVWTGPALTDFNQLWAAAPASSAVSGIGGADARVSVAARMGGARINGLGISVAFAATGTGGLNGIDLQAAIEAILRIVVGRV